MEKRNRHILYVITVRQHGSVGSEVSLQLKRHRYLERESEREV